MFKVFYLGVFAGIAGAAALLYAYPVVDQHREPSLIVVQANGGNMERFHINLPRDRIVVGMPGLPEPTPPGLDWPQSELLADVQVELFKVRNEKGVVIGTASRMSGSPELHGPFVEWAVHFPARGTLYATLSPKASADGQRRGILKSGTREFLTLKGAVAERFIREADESDAESVGRIELMASLVGPEVALVEPDAVTE